MEDFPAGPACPGPRRPPLTVVIPVHNGGAAFVRCLRGLRESDFQDFELLVVDDGSTDASAALAAAQGALVIRNPGQLGPAAARNAGAHAASAPLVFFLDADVVPHAHTIGRALEHFRRRPDLDALFGSYDDRPEAPGLVSQFRNLLHHFVHQFGRFEAEARPAHTFWTGCGLIRREAFQECGGFDPRLYRRPAIEDIELGYRLTRAGRRIALARDVQVTHLKRWTLRSMIQTDTLHRGVPWMLLMLRTRTVETDLNVSRAQRACVASTVLGLLGLAVSPLAPRALLFLVLNLLVILACNLPFYRFLVRRKGPAFAIASIPLHLVYFACCAASVAIALGLRLLLREPAPAGIPSSGWLRPAWIRHRHRRSSRAPAGREPAP